MDADRIEVLDRADDDAVSGGVDDDLELELLPAFERALDQDLADWARGDPPRNGSPQFVTSPCQSAAAAAEREGRPHDRRHGAVVELLERGDDDALRHRQPGGLHRGPEERAVLGRADRGEVGADQLDAVLGEDAVLGQLDREVQRRLAAERGEERVGTLAADDLRERGRVERLEVGRVGPLGVGHDRGRVRVREHDAVALGAQRAARLDAGVVELAALADPDRPGADDQDAAKIRGASARVGDPVEEGNGVVRPGRGLGVELERLEAVAAQALDGAVVERDVADLGRVARRDREAVVLGGDEDPLRAGDADGVVGAAVAERELERLQAEREPDELVAEADPEERHAPEQLAHGLDRPVELGGVAGAVADQDRGGLELEHRVRVPAAGHDDRLDPRLDEAADDRALAAEVEHDDPRAGADAERLRHTGVERGRGRGEAGLLQHPWPVEVRLGQRAGVQLLDRRSAERAAHRTVLAQAADERARVDLLERDDTAAGKPAGPGRPGTSHHDALRPDPARLEQRLVDAVVADERRGEGQHLPGVARVGDGLLVAGRGGREAGLAGRDPGRPDGAPREEGAVLEYECRVHLMHSNHSLCIIRSMAVATAILGGSGYSGQETLDRVLAHPELELLALGSDSLAGSPASVLDPRLNGSLPAFVTNDDALGAGAELVFCCLEHERAAALEPPAGAVVVDLSGAHRLADAALYPDWYGFEHPAPAALAGWSYAIPELFPPEGSLIANPGCYATAVLLALWPLVGAIEPTGVVVDAKSGVSGAGRTLKPSSHAASVLENVSPYKIGSHQHAPELEQALRLSRLLRPAPAAGEARAARDLLRDRDGRSARRARGGLRGVAGRDGAAGGDRARARARPGHGRRRDRGLQRPCHRDGDRGLRAGQPRQGRRRPGGAEREPRARPPRDRRAQALRGARMSVTARRASPPPACTPGSGARGSTSPSSARPSPRSARRCSP